MTSLKGLFKGISEPYYEDERYFKETETGYKIISISTFLKECYPEKYEKWLEYDRERSRKRYEKLRTKKITCECGEKVPQKTYERHKTSKKHQNKINNK
jgi:hypothetical protein